MESKQITKNCKKQQFDKRNRERTEKEEKRSHDGR